MKGPEVTRASLLLSLKKWDIKTLVELLTGRCSFNDYIGKIGFAVAAICSQYERKRPPRNSNVASWPHQISDGSEVFFNEELGHSLPLFLGLRKPANAIVEKPLNSR